MRGLVVVGLLSVLATAAHARARRPPDLCTAIATGQAGAVERALRATREVRGARCQGQPPLHHAIVKGAAFEVILSLLRAGVDVNQPGQGGDTPLILAARLRDVDLVKLLFQYGADPGRRNTIGLSAIDVAQDTGRSVLLAAMGVRVLQPAAVAEAPPPPVEDAGSPEDATLRGPGDAGQMGTGSLDARSPDSATPAPATTPDGEEVAPPPAGPGLGRKILLFVLIAAGIAIGLRLLLRLRGGASD